MLPDVPEYLLRDAFRKRDVKVNGSRVGMDALAHSGNEVLIYTQDKEQKPFVNVLYQDERVVVAVKPAGVSCEPDAKGGMPFPQLVHKQLLKADPAASCPLLCHRLDNPTEGLLLMAKDERTQLLLQQAFHDHLIHKSYTCLVAGTPKPAHAVLNAYLQKDAKHARVHVTAAQREGSKPIVTEYKVVQAGDAARLQIRLHTGRTHQIRAHMAFIGHPLLGDDRYGNREQSRIHKARRLMLCASELRFALTGELAYLNDCVFTCEPSF